MGVYALPASAAPFSDAFSSAGPIDIAGTRGTTTADLAGATRQTGEPTVSGSNTDHTVWWRYTPAASGFARFSACQPTGMNPVPGLSLGVYTGSQVNALTTIAQGTNNCPSGFENARVGPFAVTAGSYYWIQIGAATTLNVGDTDLSLTLDFNPAIPPNDNWASAMTISGALPQTFAANNGLAGVEPGEPRSDATNERQTLWYKWTATADGVVSFNTCGSAVESGMDSIISVFTGSSPATFGDLSFVDESDNGCPGAASNMSRVFVNVTNGTSYWIKLSNYTLDYGFPYALQVKWVTTPEIADLPSFFPTRFKIGATTSGSTGIWAGDPAPTITQQWRRCDLAGSNCIDIPGATSIDYTAVAADQSKTLVLRVTATNSAGSTSADSLPSDPVDSTPANDNWANATNLGTASTVSVDDDNNWATSEGASEPTIGATVPKNSVWYKWTPAVGGNYVINNCLGGPPSFDFLDLLIGIRTGTTSLASTTTVSGADDGCGPYHTYRTSTLLTATAGTTYSIEVASKSAGVTGPFTLAIAPVGNPVVTVAPALSGVTAPGGQLTLDPGDWISPTAIAPAIHWYVCDSAGAGCVDTGLGGTNFNVLPAHSGQRIKASVTLTNAYGTVTNSALSAVIAMDSDGDGILDASDTCPSEAGNKPNGCLPSDIVGTAVPVITGSLVTGQDLSSSTGSWTVQHDPLGYTLGYQWQRCTSSLPASCSDIPSATGTAYTLVAGDLAKQIRVVVTATNPDDVEVQASAISAAVTAPPPAPSNTGLPAVTGPAVAGQTLTTSNGTWTPAGVTLTYAWLRCTDNVSVGSCTAIPSQTANTYVPVGADLGKYIRSQVTASNVSGAGSASSVATAAIAGDSDGDGVPDATDTCPSEAGTKPNGCLPSDIVGAGVPGVTGTLNVGQTVSAGSGTWTVLHDPLGYTLSYQWQRCNDATPGSCSDIPGQTSNTYVLAGADYGKRVRVIVTATNADDSAAQASANSAQISQIPGNTALPGLSGTARVGQVLTATNGTWTPFDATFANSWLRCTDNVSVVSCSVIPGQTGSTYTLAAADDGKYVRARITGTTTAGSTYADSAPSAQVITDSDADGVPDATDVCPGETGTKPNGCLPSVITGTGVPTIGGTLNVGQSLTSSTGTWSVAHDPLGYTLTYQWQRCTSTAPASCSNIAGATNSAYSLVALDYANRVRVNVTATNADSTATQSSAISNLVSQVPANTAPPTMSGTAAIGQTLTGAQGAWTPASGITFANAWLRCTDNVSVASCTAIPGQTGATYVVAAADSGKYIRLQVSGTTTAGSTAATSAATALIAADSDADGVPDATDVCPSEAGTKPNGCLPSDIVAGTAPTISGTLNVGQLQTSTTGTWTVLHDPLGYTLTYQWQRCTSTSPGSCADIGGATSATYTLAALDYGNRVRVNVTAANADDSALQSSAISGLVSQLPANTAIPTISGVAGVGQVLTAAQGTWTPASGVTFTNAWLRCADTTLGSCSPIAGQTASTYTLAAADNGKYIRVQVSGQTTAGTTLATSAPTVQVVTDTDGDGVADASDVCPAEAGTKPNGCLPSVINGSGIPAISGTLNVGQSISSSAGSWTVLHDPLGYTLSYQWQRCSSTAPASCSNIGGATSANYTLVALDYGNRVRVNVTATNADSNATQSSAISNLVSQLPVNTAVPTVTGTAKVGQVLTAAQGTWTPGSGVTFTNAWLRCTDNVSTGSCTTIPGETGSTYTLVAADDGKYIRVQVSGQTTAGTTLANSTATAKVITDTDGDGVVDASDTCPAEAGTKPNGCLPSVITGSGVPAIGGTLNVGQSLTASNGSWTVAHDPLGYALSYQWQRCTSTSPASCSNIGGATSANYTLAALDYGNRVRVNVTATNADSNATQSSAITGQISQVPVNNTLPTVTGTAKVGQTLTAGNGTWTPSDAALTYAWLRCADITLGSCAAIPSQTAGTYTLVAADDGKYIRAQVTGTTAAGSAVASSAPTAKVVTDSDGDGVADPSDACPAEAGAKPNGCPPSDIVAAGAPSVSGNLLVGQVMSSTTGTWTVLHDQLGYTLAYQWQRCVDLTTASCTDIASATSSSYTLTTSELAQHVRVLVTASNADDTASQPSAISSAVLAAGSAPVNNTAPSVSGSPVVGQSLTTDTGDWTPANSTLAYTWMRCTDNSSTASCSAIASATSTSYAPVDADAGSYLRVRVTATANAQNTDAFSVATAIVTKPASPPPTGGTGTAPSGPNPAEVNGGVALGKVAPSKKGAATFRKVSVYCGTAASGNCTGTAVLTGRIGGRTATLGTVKLSTLRGGGRTIAVKLNKKAIKALKKKAIKAQLTITYTAPGYPPITFNGKATLKKK